MERKTKKKDIKVKKEEIKKDKEEIKRNEKFNNLNFDNDAKIDNKKRISKLKVSMTIIVLSMIILYIIYLVIKLVESPTRTFIVKNGKIAQEENLVGYIVREETVVKGKNYKNGMVKIKNEGDKVAKGDSIFRYYSAKEENLKNKIAELNIKIQEVIKNQKEKLGFPGDVKLLENQIEKELDLVYGINNLQKINEYKKNIDLNISKKARIVGETSPAGSYLKQLLEEKEEYENKLNADSEYINAPASGIVSYRVDGLEAVLRMDNFSQLNKNFLESLNLKTGQIVPGSEEVGKIINNYQCNIIFNSNSQEALSAKVGDNIKIRLQNSDIIKAKIQNIIDEEDGSKTISINIFKDIEKINSYRKISFDIIWWDAEGFIIPNEAIKMQDDLAYVVRNRNGYYNKMLVKILNKNDKYCIVKKYKDEELKNMGFSNKEIYNMKTIALYDEIVVKPTDEQMLQ